MSVFALSEHFQLLAVASSFLIRKFQRRHRNRAKHLLYPFYALGTIVDLAKMLGQFNVLRRRCDPVIQRMERSSPPLFIALSFVWSNFKPLIVLLVIAYCSSNIVDSYNRTNSAWIRYKNHFITITIYLHIKYLYALQC